MPHPQELLGPVTLNPSKFPSPPAITTHCPETYQEIRTQQSQEAKYKVKLGKKRHLYLKMCKNLLICARKKHGGVCRD